MAIKRGAWVLVVAAVMAQVACEGVPVEHHATKYITEDSAYHGRGPRVVVLGDSLVNAAHDRIHNEIGYRSTWIVSMAGEGFAGGPWTQLFSAPGPLMGERAAQLAATDPRVAVVALGTNDAWQPVLAGTDPIAPLQAMFAALDGACTVGVLVAEVTTADHFEAAKAVAINTAVRGNADVVVDWRLGAGEADLSADGIHLTAQGGDGFVRALRAGIDACFEAG